jgi:uncharacterized protein
LTNRNRMDETDEKYRSLIDFLNDLGNAAVAFSGGVDSTFVLYSAMKALGDRVLAITIKTPYIPDWELEEAIGFCREYHIRHKIIQAGIISEILNNPENRCYLCKKYVFSSFKEEAADEGFTNVLDGTNADDPGDFRPGLQALQELEVISPLLRTGITKEEVRQLSGKLGLPTADKPSYACLLTRLPHDYQVKPEELLRIEKAERFLISLGFGGSRVRNHGTIARIELGKGQIQEFIKKNLSLEIVPFFKSLGYEFITLDLEGYRTGSFNPSRHTIASPLKRKAAHGRQTRRHD